MGWKKILKRWEQEPQSIANEVASFFDKEYEKMRRLTARRMKKLKGEDFEQLATKFRVNGSYVYEGISKGWFIENEEFGKELNRLCPFVPLGRKPGLTEDVEERLIRAKYWEKKGLKDGEIVTMLVDEGFKAITVDTIRHDRRAEKKANKKNVNNSPP